MATNIGNPAFTMALMRLLVLGVSYAAKRARIFFVTEGAEKTLNFFNKVSLFSHVCSFAFSDQVRFVTTMLEDQHSRILVGF